MSQYNIIRYYSLIDNYQNLTQNISKKYFHIILMINTSLFISFITNNMFFSLQKCSSKFEIQTTAKYYGRQMDRIFFINCLILKYLLSFY